MGKSPLQSFPSFDRFFRIFEIRVCSLISLFINIRTRHQFSTKELGSSASNNTGFGQPVVLTGEQDL